MRNRLSALIVVVTALSWGAPAAAAETPIGTPALYKGRIIDLARDWEGAKACAVLRIGHVRCFSSEAEQWRELAKLRPPSAPTASIDLTTYCINRSDLYLTLYADTGFGGTSVSLNAADTWHDLSTYSFDNVTSSWRNNTYCDATAATGSGGTGSTTTLGARSQNSDVGSTWNDVISSVRINTA